MLTLGLFGAVWLVVQANWVRQISGDPQPRRWAAVNLCTLSALFILGVALSGYPVAAELKSDTLSRLILNLIKIVPYLIAIVQVRAAVEAEPIGLSLVGAMALFFGPVYFQFFLRDYDMPTAVGVFGPVPPALPVRASYRARSTTVAVEATAGLAPFFTGAYLLAHLACS